MADYPYTLLDAQAPQAALASIEGGEGALTLTEHWPFAVQQFAWLGPMPKGLPTKTSDGAQIKKTETIVPYMPGKILRVAAKPKAFDSAIAVDLTDGRVLLSLAGKDWRWILMKGGGLDFEAMKVGDCATTALFKIVVTLWVTSEDEVRMLVSYAYARALAEKLYDAAHEAGMRIAQSRKL